MSQRRFLLLLVFTFVVSGLAGTGWAAVKLYMKDGSYQLVKSYEVHGDRVRYYSLERSEWEEVPASLVDFKATETVQAEAAAAKKKDLEEAHELEKERFELPAQSGTEVAPGIHIPQEQGVFAFDGIRVIRLLQSSAELTRDKKRMALVLAMPGPLMKNRSLVILSGAKAAVRITAPQPVFYIQLSDGSSQNFQLIALDAGKENRVVEKIQTGIGMGKSGEMRDTVPVERAQVTPGIFKLRPTHPLAPGEYAVGELVQQKLNLDLWDFGIDQTSGK